MTQLDIGLPVKELVEPIRTCLAAGAGGGREITIDAINRRGRKVACRVLLTPLTPGEDSGRGVCILIEDTSARGGQEEAEA